MVEWRIYYSDESTFDSTMGLPEDAPRGFTDRRCVQAVVFNDDTDSTYSVGRIVLQQWDYYLYSDGLGWHGVNDTVDLIRHLVIRGIGEGGVRVVLLGAWIDRAVWNRILSKAARDPDFKHKSGRDPLRESGELANNADPNPPT